MANLKNAAIDILTEQGGGGKGSLIRKLDRLVLEGKAEIVEDPHVEGVVGWLVPGTNRALVVVYVHDEDFEVSADGEEVLAG